MLHRLGPDNEDELIETLKEYLPLYGKKEKELCEVPWKDSGVIKIAVFMWLAQQWVYIESKKK